MRTTKPILSDTDRVTKNAVQNLYYAHRCTQSVDLTGGVLLFCLFKSSAAFPFSNGRAHSIAWNAHSHSSRRRSTVDREAKTAFDFVNYERKNYTMNNTKDINTLKRDIDNLKNETDRTLWVSLGIMLVIAVGFLGYVSHMYAESFDWQDRASMICD